MVKMLKSKTLWTALGGIVTAGAGFATGEFSGADAVQTGLISLIGICLRLGIEKIGEGVK